MTGDIIPCAFSADCASACCSATAFRCRGCGKRSALVVHHRERRNRASLLVTLCVRCHMRIHRSWGLRYWFSEMLLRLWRELHPNDPVQLQLTFRNAGRKENPKGVLEEARADGAAAFGLADEYMPELIGWLVDSQESTTCPTRILRMKRDPKADLL